MKLVIANFLDPLFERSLPSHESKLDDSRMALLEHPYSLKNLIHETGTLVPRLHEVLLRRHNKFGREMIHRHTH